MTLSWVEELTDPTDPTTIDSMAQVQVTNLGPNDLKWFWANKTFIIPGTQSGRPNFAILPYHFMVAQCGDPRAFDVPNDPKRRWRTDESRRLDVLYGVYENTNDRQSLYPAVEVTTVTGTKIFTVLEDPEGANVLPLTNEARAIQDQSAIIAKMQQQLEHQQRQMDEMKRQAGYEEERKAQVLSEAQAANIRVSDNPELTPEPVNEPTDAPVSDGEFNAALAEGAGSDPEADADDASPTIPGPPPMFGSK